MEVNNQPLVSVPVITYNSAKFVLETLESIKAQTYQNIELIISDDCSTDNTVELCQKWVDENKERFVRTQIITSDVNTGVSANGNRGRAACQGEWIKGIAGDDLLMPDCVESCVDYVQTHPNITYLFGRIEVFGASEERNNYYTNNVFDYSFFDLSIDAQLERLIFGENCIPASTCFANANRSRELGIKNDERIPLLEDWPKWINILEKGVKLEFLDKVVVRYRIHEGSLSSSSRASLKSVESMQLFNFYYRFPIWCKRNNEYAINRMVKEYTDMYDSLLKTEKEWFNIQRSHAYRLGKFMLAPIKRIKKWLKL